MPASIFDRLTRFCRPFPSHPDFLLALPTDALGLMGLPLALSHGQYLALAATGARSVDAIVSLSAETLTRCVGDAAAKAIGAIAKDRGGGLIVAAPPRTPVTM